MENKNRFSFQNRTKISKKTEEPRPIYHIWNKQDAVKAIECEEQNTKDPNEIHITFPDFLLNEEIVKGFSSEIEDVEFETPVEPRKFTITLKSSEMIDKVAKDLKKHRFGMRRLAVEKRIGKDRKIKTKPEEIDPYTIHIENIGSKFIPRIQFLVPTHAEMLLGEIDKQNLKVILAINFNTVDDSIAGFERLHKRFIRFKSVKIKFKRRNEDLGCVFKLLEKLPDDYFERKKPRKTLRIERIIPEDVEIKSEPEDDEFFVGFKEKNGIMTELEEAETDCSDDSEVECVVATTESEADDENDKDGIN